MSRFIRDTITPLTAKFLPKAIRDIYEMRSGRLGIPLSDGAIRQILSRAMLRECRANKSDPVEYAMRVESMWAAMHLAIDEAMGLPDTDPKAYGFHSAEGCRLEIRKVMATNRSDRVAKLREPAIVGELASRMLDGISVHGGRPGPVFAVAFLKRFAEIVDEELASCIGR